MVLSSRRGNRKINDDFSKDARRFLKRSFEFKRMEEKDGPQDERKIVDKSEREYSVSVKVFESSKSSAARIFLLLPLHALSLSFTLSIYPSLIFLSKLVGGLAKVPCEVFPVQHGIISSSRWKHRLGRCRTADSH